MWYSATKGGFMESEKLSNDDERFVQYGDVVSLGQDDGPVWDVYIAKDLDDWERFQDRMSAQAVANTTELGYSDTQELESATPGSSLTKAVLNKKIN
jgi:hypothetical protein